MKFEEAKIKIKELKELLFKWMEEYYVNDNPSVDDSVYDSTLQELKDLENEFPDLISHDSPTQVVAAGEASLESSSFEKTVHEINMLSLDNAFNEEEVRSFDSKIKKEVEEYSYFVEPKIDGLSISLIYEEGKLVKAITRGDGVIGENVTNNALQISNIPVELSSNRSMTVRGEIFMSDQAFAEVNERREQEGDELFANPRNAASGTMRQLDPKVVKDRKLRMIAYWAMDDSDTYSFLTQKETIDGLEELGFEVSKFSRFANNVDEVLEVINSISDQRKNIGYEIDGIVIKVNNSDLYTDIGYTSKFPKWAIAFKFPAEVKETILKDIFATVGRTGRITYNAVLEPVELAGTIVQRATLHNSDYVNDLDLRIGDYVNVKKAGEIIPKVISSNKAKRPEHLERWIEDSKCPACESELKRKTGEVDQYCDNVHCSGRLTESIIHFASRDAMNIEGLSTKQIERFISLGWINSFSDIYKLKDRSNEILSMEGYQEKSVNSLIASIEKSKSNGLDKLLFGLGIRHIGKKSARDLAKSFGSLDNLTKVSLEELLLKNDLGEVKSNSIVEYFSTEDNILELNELESLGINPIMETKEVDSNHKLYNKKVVVTGTIEGYNRNQVKEYLEGFGAQITTSVSGATDYLIIGEKASPGKISKMPPEKVIKFIDIDKL